MWYSPQLLERKSQLKTASPRVSLQISIAIDQKSLHSWANIIKAEAQQERELWQDLQLSSGTTWPQIVILRNDWIRDARLVHDKYPKNTEVSHAMGNTTVKLIAWF